MRSDRLLRRLGHLALGLYLLLLCVGLVLFIPGRTPPPTPLLGVPPAISGEPLNVAWYGFGSAVYASSTDSGLTSHHHALYVVDGHQNPSDDEQWSSHPADEAPWLGVRLGRRYDVHQIVLDHGEVPGGPVSNRNFTIRCMPEGGPERTVEVRDNSALRSVHEVDCPNTFGVRIDFNLGGPPADQARVREVEVWAR